MDCEQTLTLLSARLDGELPTDDRGRLDDHLQTCDACRTAAEAFQIQHGELQAAIQPRREAADRLADHIAARLPTVAVPRPRRFGRRAAVALALAASVAGLTVYLAMRGHWQPPNPGPGPDPGPSPVAVNDREYLTPRPRPAVAAPTPLKVGESVATEAGRRTRAALPDGSLVYLNQSTHITLVSADRVRLDGGEVFVEVVPRKAGEPPLVVETPQRQVTALGTRFAVRAAARGTGVLVTQGKVQVSGVADPLAAGQELAVEAESPRPAPRASASLDWTRDLMAQAESPLVPGSRYSGGALVAVDAYGQEANLTLRDFRVDVHVEDGFARTTIDQTYFNHANSRLEGTFYFPLPPDASLSRLAMYVGEGEKATLMEGGMAERDYARRVYEEVRYTQSDPALLEWVDGSTFKMRVFPLEARQEKRIVLSYTQQLPALYGRTTYRFPAGHSLHGVRDWNFHALVKNGAAYRWNSPSHPAMRGTPVGPDLFLDASAHDARIDRDVTVELAASGDPVTQPSLFATAEHEDYRYLMVKYRPDLPGRLERRRRDWVFLFEASGDRDPLLARTQVELVRTLLSNAEHDDTFAVLAAGTRVHKFSEQPVPATPAQIEAACAFLERTHLIGALDLGQALAEAEPLLKAGQDAHLVHLGSGVAALGERRADELLKRIPAGTRYVGVGVGKRWERGFMKAAAERSGGFFTQVNPDESVSWRGFDLLATLNTPRLMDVKVTAKTPAGQEVAFLGTAAMLSQGEELCAIARLDKSSPLPAAVAVAGRLDGQTFEKVLPVEEVRPGADYLPRTWAKLEIDRLLAENSSEHRQTVIDLSKAMYVMTPFTSLLVLENEAMYERFKVDRGRKDHWALYDCPKTIPVVYEPDPTQVDDAPNAPRKADQKPTTNQVLNTIQTRTPPRWLAWPGRQEGDRATRSESATVWAAISDGSVNTLGLASNMLGEGDPPEQLFAGDEKEKLGRDSDVFRRRANGERLYFGFGGGKDKQIVDRLGDAEEATPALMSTRSFGAVSSRKSRRSGQGWGEFAQNGLLSDLSSKDEPPSLRSGLILHANKFGLFSQSEDLRLIEGQEIDGKLGAIEANKSAASGKGKLARMLQGESAGPRLYGQPTYRGDERVFTDLPSYAPGLTTSPADVRAVLEAEAARGLSAGRGAVDPAARKLIDRARAAGWQSIALPVGKAEVRLHYDGRGRYAYERGLPLGLSERVVCDGSTLLHLYPELGLGARRTVSRFHRADLADLVPWLVLPAEDLADRADVKAIDERTVALVPLDPPAKPGEPAPPPAPHLHLVFAADGALAERVLVAQPGGKVLARETYDAAGTVRRLDADGKERAKVELKRQASAGPDLRSNADALVVLPMPLRTPQHVYPTLGLHGGSLGKSVENECFAYLDPASTLELFTTAVMSRNLPDALRIYRTCYGDKGDRRIGFFTLLTACGLNAGGDPDFRQLWHARPDEPLVKYLALVNSPTYCTLQKRYGVYGCDAVAPSESFLGRLAHARDLFLRWSWEGDQAWLFGRRASERKRALTFAQTTDVPGWALLSQLQARTNSSDPAGHLDLAEAYGRFRDVPGFRDVALYERANELMYGGRRAEARQQFRAMFDDALKAGMLMPIDGRFSWALLGQNGEPDLWNELVRATATRLIADGHREAAVILAWQCHQVDEAALATNVLAQALQDIKDENEKRRVTLTAIEFLWQTGQQAAADQKLSELLAEPVAESASAGEKGMRAGLWRLAARFADGRGQAARAVDCLERALDIEYRLKPEVIDVQAVRGDYGRVLSHYQALADAVVALKVEPPSDLLARTIRAADRWRALDRDNPADACNRAARILQTLREKELAWEYLTTPVAQRPNESGGWWSLAVQQNREGNLALADEAYAAAFAAEPTNAQILWDRAQNLRQAGQADRSREMLKQLADTDWQPRFQRLKAQARWQVSGK